MYLSILCRYLAKAAAQSLLTELVKQNLKAEGETGQQVAAKMAQEAKERQAALEAETEKYTDLLRAQDRANWDAAMAKAEAERKAQREAEAKEKAATSTTSTTYTTSSCFVASSPVLTPEGERPISELAVGDRVITLDRNGKETVGVVTEVMTPREAEIVEVTFSNGTVWRTTESQTVWLGHEQNYEIKEDAVGKKALLRSGESVAVTSVKYTGKYETVYDVLIGEEEDEDVIFVAGIAAEGYFTKGERGLS